MVISHDSFEFRSKCIGKNELLRFVLEVDEFERNRSDKSKPGVCVVHCLVECNCVGHRRNQ